MYHQELNRDKVTPSFQRLRTVKTTCRWDVQDAQLQSLDWQNWRDYWSRVMKETSAWKEREDVISGSQVDSVREETLVVWTTCHDHPLLFRKCLPILKSAPNRRVIYGIFPCASITLLNPDSSVAGGQRALGGSCKWWRGATLCEQYTSHVTFSRWSTFNDTHMRGSSLIFGVRSGHLHALMCLIWLLTWSKLSESCPVLETSMYY